MLASRMKKNNHRLYYVTTKIFNTFSEPKLFYDPGFSCIDATLVKRGTDDYVMVVGTILVPTPTSRWLCKSAEGPYYPPASEPFTESFTEGPSVAKVGNDYYIYYDTYRKFIYSALQDKGLCDISLMLKTVWAVPKDHKHGTTHIPLRVR